MDLVKVDHTCRTMTTSSGSSLRSQICLYLHCPAGDEVKKKIFILSNARLILSDILFWQGFSSFICSALNSGVLAFFDTGVV